MSYRPDYKYIPPLELDALTSIYDGVCALAGLGKGFKRKVLGVVQLNPGQTALDVGCGTGVFLEVAAQNYPQVNFLGLDPDEGALAIARKRLLGFNNVRLIQAYGESLPLGDESADVVFSTLAFHHMPDKVKKQSVEEIKRVLKPDGRVVIADFGKLKHPIWGKIFFFWEKLEYLEGNLKGLMPEYLASTGFKNIMVARKHFPALQIIKAEK